MSPSVDEVSMADSFGYGAGGLDQAILLGSRQQLQVRGVVVAGSPHQWHHRNTEEKIPCTSGRRGFGRRSSAIASLTSESLEIPRSILVEYS